MNYSWQVVNPTLQHLKAILAALNLPEPTKESTVFELFSQIETKVSTISTIQLQKWVILKYKFLF